MYSFENIWAIHKNWENCFLVLIAKIISNAHSIVSSLYEFILFKNILKNRFCLTLNLQEKLWKKKYTNWRQASFSNILSLLLNVSYIMNLKSTLSQLNFFSQLPKFLHSWISFFLLKLHAKIKKTFEKCKVYTFVSQNDDASLPGDCQQCLDGQKPFSKSKQINSARSAVSSINWSRLKFLNDLRIQ